MPATVKKAFDSYKVWYYSNFSYEALIYCYQGTKYVGRIVFMKDDATLPRNGYASPFGDPQVSLHMPIKKFNDVINLLREEKPLYLFLNVRPGIGILGTEDFEPVGEEEGT